MTNDARWRALKKAWKQYKEARRMNSGVNMKRVAMRITRIQREAGLEATDFSEDGVTL